MPHSVPERRHIHGLAALPISLTATVFLVALSACGSGSESGNGTGGTSGGTGGAAQTGTGGTIQSGSGGVTHAGSGGATQTGTGGMTAAACTYGQTVIPTTCAQIGCHVPSGFAPDLSTEAMAAAAVNKPIVQPCPGDPMVKYLINPTAPVTGLLVDRISGPLCGALMQMPFGKPPLTQAEVDCIKSFYLSKIH